MKQHSQQALPLFRVSVRLILKNDYFPGGHLYSEVDIMLEYGP